MHGTSLMMPKQYQSTNLDVKNMLTKEVYQKLKNSILTFIFDQTQNKQN